MFYAYIFTILMLLHFFKPSAARPGFFVIFLQKKRKKSAANSIFIVHIDETVL